MEKQTRNRQEEANCVSRLFFWWALPIIRLANKRELEMNDFDVTPTDHKCDYLKSRFRANWNMEILNTKPNLLKTLLRTFRKEIMFTFLTLLICQLLLKIGTPILLGYLLRSLEWNETPVYKFMLAGIYVIFIFGNTILVHHVTNYSQRCGVMARIALTGLIYEKVVRLSQISITKTGTGQVTNLVSNDLNRFNMGMDYIFYALVAPIQGIVAIAILWRYVGISVFASIILLTTYALFIGLWYSKTNAKLRMETAKSSDKRIRLISEVITGLFLVKMLLLEAEYVKAIGDARKSETSKTLSRAKLQAVGLSIFDVATRINILLTILIFILLRNSMTAETVFVVISVLNVVGVSIGMQLPVGSSILAEITTSVKRIEAFLLLEEKLPRKVVSYSNSDVKIDVQNLSIKWNPTSQLVLYNLTFSARPGELVGVIGSVGSGKSTLLLSLLSEISPEAGRVNIVGSSAYVGQEAWLLPETIKENILFGHDYEPKWYQTVVEACALKFDLEKLEYGDKTIIGEKGTNLSGGQKARIALARACYSKADIYLLDDPISAVDASVGRHIMEECIHGILKDKCVILVTHHVHFLQNANKIIRIENSSENESSYEPASTKELTIDELFDMDKTVELEATLIQKTEPQISLNYGTFQPKVSEIQSVGKIRSGVIMEYIKAGNSSCGLLVAILLPIFCQVFLTGSDIWIKIWIDLETKNETTASETLPIYPENTSFHFEYVGSYGVLILFGGILILAKALTIFTSLDNSSIKLHAKLTNAIIRAPMRFVEINTTGGILNRFALDTGIMDEVLPARSYVLISTLFQVIGSTVIVCISSPIMLLPAAVIYSIEVIIVKMYLRAAATIKRLEAIGRSPVLTQISYTISGLSTIRSCEKQDFLIEKFNDAQDAHTSVYLSYLYTARCLFMNVEILGDMFALIVITWLVATPTSASTFGLVATSLLTIISITYLFTNQVGELSTQLTAVERVIEFTKVKSEAPLTLPKRKPSKHWPNSGSIQMDNLCVRYENGPPVLQNINIDIKPNEKVGIIGRTGAGKSTLVGALLRIIEKSSGYIHIDGVNVSEIGLHDLRDKISIIPQNPFLFSGTVRKSIDPFGRYHDNQIWEAITMVHMQERLRSLASGLELPIKDGGSNFSQGERQLLGIARTLLQQNKFLVLDEATSSIDARTDTILQEVLRTRYKNCTVLTIAHRLNTVMDSDRILVLDSGRVVEFSDPVSLLENPNSYLHRLVQKTGPVNAQKLYNKAQEYMLGKQPETFYNQIQMQ